MSRDFEIHNLSNLTEEELWESVDELKSMVEGEIEWREERAEKEKKIEIPSELWVELYSELSSYVENKCYPNRKTHNEEGERLNETQDDFCEIVGEVEGILRSYFRKEEI
tara:strand:+ start:407 stop:736 length:330 start_codon:yes stop_codon:yes gene_type:complete